MKLVISRKRPGKLFPSFAKRTLLLLSVFLVLSNLAFVMAQGVMPDSAALMRLAIRGDAYLDGSGLFIAIRESALIPSFGIAMLVFVALSLGHFFKFGPKDMSAEKPEDEIPWWSLGARIVHGIVAITFVILFISGLMITFGKYLGGGGGTLFMRIMHEFSGLIFAPAVLVMIVMWIGESIPKAYDLEWFAKFGGYLGYKGELKSGKFNAGQKLWYWVMAITGILLSLSGLALFFKLGEMESMRTYIIIHFFSAIPMMLMFLVHLYMTTLGTKGALMGIIHGRFSKKAAEAYHSEASALKNL